MNNGGRLGFFNTDKPFTASATVTSAGTETITLAQGTDESTTATVTGSVTAGDVTSITVQNANLTGGQKTISYTVAGGDTTTTIATALKNAINADTSLQGVGVQATSAANVVTISPFTYFTGSSSGTETVSISNASRGSAAITIGGTVTTGNTVTITPHNPALSGGLKNITYTVVAGDTLTSISKSLAALINADTALKGIGVSVNNAATLAWSQSFSGNALLPSGSSLASITAVDGSSNTKTNPYAISVKSATSSNLTYDLNGNMTSDGTNSYSWDAENRMIKITYPGTGNFSSFVYDSSSRNVKITEFTASTATEVKQFVWWTTNRSEQRDGAGLLISKYFTGGQSTAGTNYMYCLDHLGSVREMFSASGVLSAEYEFDPFGRMSALRSPAASDFAYAGYYVHARTGLSLTRTRAYNSVLGRFLSRDIATADDNLFHYTNNMPTSAVDPSGMRRSGPIMWNRKLSKR